MRLLNRRLPGVRTIVCAAEMLALEDGCADLTTACATVGPNPRVLEELTRVTRTGGEVVLVSPEESSWFEARGWRRIVFDPIPAPPHEAWIDEIFGPPDPPHELVSLRVRRSCPL